MTEEVYIVSTYIEYLQGDQLCSWRFKTEEEALDFVEKAKKSTDNDVRIEYGIEMSLSSVDDTLTRFKQLYGYD